MSLPTAIKNQKELLDYLLKKMKPGMLLSGLKFKVIDEKKNQVDLENTTILCRERYFIKESKIINEFDYRYEVIASRYLGEGACGTVFPIIATLKLNSYSKIKVLKKRNNKQRVVKVIPDGLSAELNVKNEFSNSDTVAYLHIKPPIKVKFPDGYKYYLVMRKIPGQTLLDLLNNGSISNLDTNRKFLLLFSLLETLKSLHLKNLVHGDINCGNIMVDFESEPRKPSIKIIDFGSSRLKSPADGKIAKTPNITLETNCKNASQASDVFSLGKIFWFICNKNNCDPALNQLLDVEIFFKDSGSQHSNWNATLFDVFQLLIGMLSQSVNEKLNKFHQSIVQTIYAYIQKTYNASSNDKSDPERIINNIRNLLIILRKNSFNEQKLKNKILNWRKSLKKNSELYHLVSEMDDLKRKNMIQSLFFGKPSNAYSTKQQRSVFDLLLCRP